MGDPRATRIIFSTTSSQSSRGQVNAVSSARSYASFMNLRTCNQTQFGPTQRRSSALDAVCLAIVQCQVAVCLICHKSMECFYTPLGASPSFGDATSRGSTLSSGFVAATLKEGKVMVQEHATKPKLWSSQLRPVQEIARQQRDQRGSSWQDMKGHARAGIKAIFESYPKWRTT